MNKKTLIVLLIILITLITSSFVISGILSFAQDIKATKFIPSLRGVFGAEDKRDFAFSVVVGEDGVYYTGCTRVQIRVRFSTKKAF